MILEEIQIVIAQILGVQKQLQNSQAEFINSLEEVKKLGLSNTKSIAALTNNLTALSDEVRITQQQMRDSLRRIDDNSMNTRDIQADIRELQIENKRILRYLESRVNQEDTSKD